MIEVPASTQELILPVLPMRNMVLFPGMLAPLAVGRPISCATVEMALGSEDKTLIVVAQLDPTDDRLTLDSLHRVGTRAVIKRMGRSEQAPPLAGHQGGGFVHGGMFVVIPGLAARGTRHPGKCPGTLLARRGGVARVHGGRCAPADDHAP